MVFFTRKMRIEGTRKRQTVFTYLGSVVRTPDRLTVKTVVDSVNNVVSRRGSDGESAFVLLDHILIGGSKSLNVVQVTNSLVWSVGGDLSGNRWVKTRHLQVNSNVGVVNIDDASSSQKSNGFVITDGLSFRSEGGKSGNTQSGSSGGHEFTSLSGEFSGWSGDLSVGREGGNSAAIQ